MQKVSMVALMILLLILAVTVKSYIMHQEDLHHYPAVPVPSTPPVPVG